MVETKPREVIPDPARLMRSLRDVGYDFSTAVADLVDNSIEAGATLIDIKVEFDGDNSWVRIVDNGRGMHPFELIEAMRYGSARDYDESDLGKFGLGLKTASMSQCRFFAVASRAHIEEAIQTYCWDLSHVERNKKWQITPLTEQPWLDIISSPLRNYVGTVVLWRQLDRIVGCRHPYGQVAQNKLMGMCSHLEEHLAMVFHRFMEGDIPHKKPVKIRINGNSITPWDPFVRSEKKTQVLPFTRLPVEYENVHGEVLIEPFVLPAQSEFSTLMKFREAAGPLNWNQQQGFYIYRAGRMIQSGGWCRLRARDEHTKLARIAISFPPILDDAFKINVAKMRVQLPAAYRDDFDNIIKPVVKVARETYDKKRSRRIIPRGTPSQRPTVTTTMPAHTVKSAKQFWTLDELEKKLTAVAEDSEKSSIKSVFERLRKTLGVET